MSSKGPRVPRLCHRKDKNLAYVTDPDSHLHVYFGPWGSSRAGDGYAMWVKNFLARRAGQALAALSAAPEPTPGPPPSLTVAALCARYLDFARTYYVKRGKVTTEVNTIEQVVSRLNARSGGMEAASYGPRHLKELRDGMAAERLGRGHVNKQLHRVRRVWKWAVSEDLLPASCLTALRAVPGLAKGRSAAREETPVPPVPWDVVAATLPFLKPRHAALALFQLWGAMRPGEAVVCRPGDVDRSRTPWEYRPWSHKTEHHDRARVVYLGPKAREALAPHLGGVAPAGWVWRSLGRGPHAGKTGHLRERSYARAVEKAVERANVVRRAAGLPPLPHWCPAQLRHSAATAIRAAHGLEGAQTILGHAEMNTTELYAEKSEALARRVAEEMG